jgi:hypothetical protein
MLFSILNHDAWITCVLSIKSYCYTNCSTEMLARSLCHIIILVHFRKVCVYLGLPIAEFFYSDKQLKPVRSTART